MKPSDQTVHIVQIIEQSALARRRAIPLVFLQVIISSAEVQIKQSYRELEKAYANSYSGERSANSAESEPKREKYR